MKRYRITWENRYSKVIEANSRLDAEQKALDVESNTETYDERVFEDIEEV